MSKADKMFEELGYEKNTDFQSIKYKKDDENVYYFDYIRHEFYKSGEYDGMCEGTNMPELQAINEKCKELGWLNE